MWLGGGLALRDLEGAGGRPVCEVDGVLAGPDHYGMQGGNYHVEQVTPVTNVTHCTMNLFTGK